MRVLVVDDELVSRKKMHKIMSGFGESESAESGSTALSLIERALELDEPYDLMTLDIDMPDMSGVDVLKFIRLQEQEKNVSAGNKMKILMVTSYSDQENVKKCINAGCDNYIVKPFDKDLVMLKLKQLNITI